MNDRADQARDEKSRSALQPMRNSIFRSVWLASLVSNFGGLIQSVGASWMMTSISRSAEMVTLVQASVTLPIMLLSLTSGALADNFDRRRMMLGAQIFMLFVSAALAGCAWSGLITPWLLLAFTFMIGCGTAFYGPAWQASVGDMVDRPDLPGAVALNSMNFNIARSLGPALGGAIVAAAGAAAAFAVNALSYVPLIAVLGRWRPNLPPRSLPRETLGIAMAAGVRYAAMSPAIRTVLGRSALFGLSASAISSLMPLIARDLIAGGPLVYGMLLGAFGVGAVTGAFTSARLRSAFQPEAIVRGSCIAFGVVAALVGFIPYLPATMGLLVVAGAAWVLVLSTFNVTVQLNSPRWVVARALSLYQMAAFGGMALGAWLSGVIAEDHGIAAALVTAACLQVGCTALGLRLPLPPSSNINLDPLRKWEAPETEVAIEPRSGPVVIAIEYRIRPEDRRQFLAVMADRRRIRRRDGARHWTLLRDLGDAEVWIERYHFPTWTEYHRHNNRITQADAEVTERLRAFHQGTEPPQVRRMIERQTGSLPESRAPRSIDLAQPMTDPNLSS